MSGLHSLRVRLTATFVGIVALLVAAGLVGAAWLLDRAVWRPLDAALVEEADSIDLVREADRDEDQRGGEHEEDDDADVEDIAAAIAHLGRERDLGPDKFIVVLAPDGGLVAASGRVPTEVGTNAGVQPKGVRFVEDGGGTYRVLSRPMVGGAWVKIGVRVDRQVQILHRARLSLLAGAAALLLGLAVLAWTITSRAMREIADVTAELRSIEVDSLSRRVAARTTDEIQALVHAFNDLLGRLELAVHQLRRFAADTAHELRTPLAALRAHLDVALARPPSIAGYRDGLLDAVEQTEKLSLLAKDLLALSAIESGSPPVLGPVDLGAVTREVAEFLEAVAQEQERPFAVTVEDHAVVCGEVTLLKRLLLNLLGNAFTHTPRGVAVTLSVTRGNGEVILVVSDRGDGVGRADNQALSNILATRNRRRAGTGLGLTICREIVLMHHGTIAIDIDAMTGTTVTVRLPSPEPVSD